MNNFYVGQRAMTPAQNLAMLRMLHAAETALNSKCKEPQEAKLAHELRGLGWKEDYVDEVLEMPSFKAYAAGSLGDLNSELQASLLSILSSMSQISNETEQSILDAPVRAIFAYGTLRGDFSPTGDKWGVAQHGCHWQVGSVPDFAIYQNPNLYYPFAVRSPGGKIIGTLLEWNNEKTFAAKLRQCNSIEGYDPISQKGLYNRLVVRVTTSVGEIPAYMFFQQADEQTLKSCLSFSTGDWLASRS